MSDVYDVTPVSVLTEDSRDLMWIGIRVAQWTAEEVSNLMFDSQLGNPKLEQNVWIFL